MYREKNNKRHRKQLSIESLMHLSLRDQIQPGGLNLKQMHHSLALEQYSTNEIRQ